MPPLSYWHDSLVPDDDLSPRAALPGDRDADVAIVGAIRGVDSDLVRLPWVGHRSKQWEREPLRWLGVHTVASLAHVTDAIDTRRGHRRR